MWLLNDYPEPEEFSTHLMHQPQELIYRLVSIPVDFPDALFVFHLAIALCRIENSGSYNELKEEIDESIDSFVVFYITPLLLSDKLLFTTIELLLQSQSMRNNAAFKNLIGFDRPMETDDDFEIKDVAPTYSISLDVPIDTDDSATVDLQPTIASVSATVSLQTQPEQSVAAQSMPPAHPMQMNVNEIAAAAIPVEIPDVSAADNSAACAIPEKKAISFNVKVVY